jgi:hypothetical protein
MGESDMNKIFAIVEKILATCVQQVTLTRRQAEMLVAGSRKVASKTRDKDTQRLRLELYRSEQELRAVADRMKEARK